MLLIVIGITQYCSAAFLIFQAQSYMSGEPGNVLYEGATNCLGLHKDGLYAAGEDGVLRQLELSANRVKVRAAFHVGNPVTSMNWNGPHDKLALGSKRVSDKQFLFQCYPHLISLFFDFLDLTWCKSKTHNISMYVCDINHFTLCPWNGLSHYYPLYRVG